MKTLFTFLFLLLVITACNNPDGEQTAPKISDLAYFEWQGADYWVLQCDTLTTKQDAINFVKNHTHSQKTSWVFFYPDTADYSVYSTEKFNLSSFHATIAAHPPQFSFYRMMPADTTVYDDAFDYIKIAVTQ